MRWIAIVGVLASSAGCFPMITQSIEVTVGTGTTPTLTWAGGSIGHIDVIEIAKCPDCPAVLDIDRELSSTQVQNPIKSPYSLGDLPAGAIEYHADIDTWDSNARPLQLTAGTTYRIDVGRYSNDGSALVGHGEVEYTP